jgi:hypothetical protein
MEPMELFLTPHVPNRPSNPFTTSQAMYLNSMCAVCKLFASLDYPLTPINLLHHEVFAGIENALADRASVFNGTDHHLLQGCFAYIIPQ